MRKRCLSLFIVLLICGGAIGQQPKDKPFIDSTSYYDDLFDDMEQFLDSILAPRTFFMAEVGVSSAYFNYTKSGSFDLQAKRRATWSPSVGWYHKSGLGITASATIVNDGDKANAFQYLATAAYDYIKDSRFTTGINYTRYFTKNDLPFYTTPLQNEIGTYFTWKRWWVKPAVFASYGWGSRNAFNERAIYIISLRLRPDGFTRINTNESISDFSLSLSARHDFYWLNWLLHHATLRMTPQFVFTAGTQKFGFNENSNTYGVVRATSLNELINSDNMQLDDELRFQPISFSGILRFEWTWKHFFVQPQYVASYYFPAGNHNFLGQFRLGAGLVF